jgi:hypothetical protein
MQPRLSQLFDDHDGVATSAQILRVTSRRAFERELRHGDVTRLWQGIYGRGEPTDDLRLRGLDLACGTTVAACLATAAAFYGFDVDEPTDLHVLDPGGGLRSVDGLTVHRRDGAPLTTRHGRPLTAAAWTAVEVARSQRRPRALATLDAALRSGTTTRSDIWRAAVEQAGRRGIVAVRGLIALADERAESPMESEARLAMVDGGLPMPELQYELIDGNGELRRLDFAWPRYRVAVEYDGVDWHSDPDVLRRDRERTNALRDVGWTVIPIVSHDVRRRGRDLVARINGQFLDARAA